MKIGIMQPYFLPFIGYFALIKAVDKFVYYDDVQYIRRGWVNRNRVKMKDKWLYITLPLKNSPLSTDIKEFKIINDKKKIGKIKNTIKHCYIKAPYYEVCKNLIFKHIKPGENLSKLNIGLTNDILKYLKIHTETLISSEINKDPRLTGVDKIIVICKKLNGNHYINPIGGKDLYSKKQFQESCIKLNFIKMNDIIYPQGGFNFIKYLSILDVMVWNSPETINNMLDHY